MTIRNLLNIILKVIGILFIRDLLGLLPQLLSAFVFFSNPNEFQEGTMVIALSGIMVLTYLIIARLFIFKTESLINWLRLDHDFEEEKLVMQMHRSTILSISIIVIGGLMVAEGLPRLIESLSESSLKSYYSFGKEYNNNSKLYGSIATVFIGVLLMGLQQRIVNLIELKRFKTDDELDEHED